MPVDILDNILEQPQVLGAALKAHLAPHSPLGEAAALLTHRPRRIVFSGMGSSLFACYPAFLRLVDTGFAAIWVELAELLHYGAGALGPDTTLVLVSQSGETVEALRLLEAHAPQGPIIAVTNNPASTLARRANVVVPIGAGAEQTVATKSYSASLLALWLLAERLCGAAPADIEAQMEAALTALGALCAAGESLVGGLPAEWREPGPLTLLGRGPSLATALAGGLLFKETAKIQAEGLSSAQFRHGPIETCGPGQRVIICAGAGHAAALSRSFAKDLASYGSHVLLVGAGGAHGEGIAQLALPEVTLPALLEIVPLQLLARAMAQRQGLEPGAFKNATKVTTTE